MNLCVPDWGMEDDFRSFHDHFPASNEMKSTEPDDELVELLWRNGHFIMQSQNNRKPPTNVCELKQAQKPDPPLKPVPPPVSPTNLIQDETASWFQYTIDDPLEKAFSPDFLDDMPTALYTVDTNKPNKEVTNGLGGNSFKMPPPTSHIGDAQMASTMVNDGPANFSHFSRLVKADMGSSSIRTVGSSACGSNQVQNQTDVSYNLSKGVNTRISPKERARANTFDTTGTSSSGGSGCSFGRIMGCQSTANLSHKRKGRHGEESESHSEEAEFESVEADRATQRPESARKSRAAEVHNQSERRRRDRINEKMRALQLLIPHCNKSDKASMLDEAIEYLKSLQLQLQLMWMGSGMTSMMFPGVQQYMPQMGHASVPSINNHIQLPRNPLANHSIPSTPSANQMPMCMSPTAGPVNFPTQMQNVHLPQSYARYYGYPHMQLPAQHMNLYTYGSHVMQQNQSAGSSSLAAAGIPSENIQNGQSGN